MGIAKVVDSIQNLKNDKKHSNMCIFKYIMGSKQLSRSKSQKKNWRENGEKAQKAAI